MSSTIWLRPWHRGHDISAFKAAGSVWHKVVIVLQRVMVRTERSPLRPVWAGLYAGVMRAVAAYLCHGQRGAAAYVARSVAIDEPVYGISDIELLVVIPGDPRRRREERRRLRRRWERLCRAVPLLGRLMPDVAFYEDVELREATVGSVLTYGLGDGARARGDRAAFLGTARSTDDFGLRSRPGVYGPTWDWRSIRGPDRRPHIDAPDRQERRIAAWLELQFWWSFAFGLAAEPEKPSSALLCVKLIAEPARIWLSLVDGAVIPRRRDVLQRALVRLPEEEEAIRRALELHQALSRRPRPPLAETLPAFVRLTSRVARRLREELEGKGQTPVRLTGGAGTELVLPPVDGCSPAAGDHQRAKLLPLVDWRALAVPSLPDEACRLVSGNAGDSDDLRRLADAGRSGSYPVLKADGLLVLPALGVWGRAFLRSVACQPTDPVTFALVEGVGVARFPNVRGWSAEDWARRAVAEHRAWLMERPGTSPPRPEWSEVAAAAPTLRDIGWLLTAARAGFFLESIEAGDPELRLTIAAVADRLSEGGAGARTAAESAVDAYRAGLVDGVAPSAETVAPLRELVEALPAYAGRL
jgi:hypothetical protein